MNDKTTDKKRSGGFDWRKFTPDDSPKTPVDLMADATRKDLATAKVTVGDLAYDFTSPIHDFSDGKEKATGGAFRLTEVAASKPVALIFGSYT